MRSHGTNAPRILGGGNFLKLRKLLKLYLSLFIITALYTYPLTSCEKEYMRYAEMQAYYDESCHLFMASTDSVTRFSDKVEAFVGTHPDAKEDVLYPQIQKNIEQYNLGLTITFNDDWDDDIHITF